MKPLISTTGTIKAKRKVNVSVGSDPYQKSNKYNRFDNINKPKFDHIIEMESNTSFDKM